MDVMPKSCPLSIERFNFMDVRSKNCMSSGTGQFRGDMKIIVAKESVYLSATIGEKGRI